MNRLSIKNRIVFWYAFAFLLILILVFSILFAVGNKVVRDEVKSDLTILTDRAVRDVQIVSGEMIIDDDIVYYMDDSYVVLCNADGTVISGIIPDGFPDQTAFSADQISEVSGADTSWLVYDRLIENQKTGQIWVRGMAEASLAQAAPAMAKMLHVFLVALPVLLFLVILGGWYITRQAFLPLKRMNETAEQIQKSGDLSRRLGFGDASSKDEIRNTAAVIDGMIDKIEESFAAEKRFTNDASHELRTPTAVILAECEYAMSHLNDETELKTALEAILYQSNKMKKLISELLMLARADRGMIRIEKRPVDVSLLAEEAAGALRRNAALKQIRIMVDAPEGCYLDGDEALLGRMLENLVSNAIKYGRKNGSVRILIVEKTAPEEIAACLTALVQKQLLSSSDLSVERLIHISVADDGIGIAQEELPKIWNRFYRVSEAGGDESMGLGLSLVKWIVEAHDGIITTDSTPGVGTVFEIFFLL